MEIIRTRSQDDAAQTRRHRAAHDIIMCECKQHAGIFLSIYNDKVALCLQCSIDMRFQYIQYLCECGANATVYNKQTPYCMKCAPDDRTYIHIICAKCDKNAAFVDGNGKYYCRRHKTEKTYHLEEVKCCNIRCHDVGTCSKKDRFYCEAHGDASMPCREFGWSVYCRVEECLNNIHYNEDGELIAYCADHFRKLNPRNNYLHKYKTEDPAANYHVTYSSFDTLQHGKYAVDIMPELARHARKTQLILYLALRRDYVILRDYRVKNPRNNKIIEICDVLPDDPMENIIYKAFDFGSYSSHFTLRKRLCRISDKFS